ncbi:MAG: hypothetical protein ACE5EB_04720 [Thermodesulfobacteriota bacterium]
MVETIKETKKRLQEAIDTGEVLNIIYQGGSQPGTVREISPISIKGGRVKARCLNSHKVKSFNIEKITIVDSEKAQQALRWQVSTELIRHYNSVTELLEKEKEFLIQLGWHIESSNDSLSLHRRFKNGKPMKGSDVSLDYEEYTYDMLYGDDGEFHEEKRKKIKPWTVRGKNKDTRTYGSFDAAANVFKEWAALMAPNKEE